MCYLSIKDTLEQRAGVSCDKVDPTLQREEKMIWLEEIWFVDKKNKKTQQQQQQHYFPSLFLLNLRL